MMSTSTLLFLIISGQFLLSIQELTLRLKGNNKDIIPDGGDVEITDLPVGGCRRYDTLECLSDVVPYRGKVPNAYWVYVNETDKYHRVDNIRCKGDECWKFGWQSSLGVYKKDNTYYSVVRLGRHSESAIGGTFKCFFEGKTKSSVSVNMHATTECSTLTAPNDIEVTNFTKDINGYDEITTFSWDEPCGGVDSYTFYYTIRAGIDCYNDTLPANMTSIMVENVREIQIAAHRSGMTRCSQVQNVTFGNYELMMKASFKNENGCKCTDEG